MTSTTTGPTTTSTTRTRKQRTATAVGLGVLLLALVCTILWQTIRGPELDPQAAAQTALSDPVEAAEAPTLPGLDTARPGRGKAVQVAGPFDDRFTMSGLAFDGRAVTGIAQITSEVSHLIDFEALAGFYDDRGTLLGTSRYTYHSTLHAHGNGPALTAELRQEFRIEVPKQLRGAAVAAAVGVPVLVNE